MSTSQWPIISLSRMMCLLNGENSPVDLISKGRNCLIMGSLGHCRLQTQMDSEINSSAPLSSAFDSVSFNYQAKHSFLSLSFFFSLAVSGVSCGTQDLCYVTRDLSRATHVQSSCSSGLVGMWHVGS